MKTLPEKWIFCKTIDNLMLIEIIQYVTNELAYWCKLKWKPHWRLDYEAQKVK